MEHGNITSDLFLTKLYCTPDELTCSSEEDDIVSKVSSTWKKTTVEGSDLHRNAIFPVDSDRQALQRRGWGSNNLAQQTNNFFCQHVDLCEGIELVYDDQLSDRIWDRFSACGTGNNCAISEAPDRASEPAQFDNYPTNSEDSIEVPAYNHDSRRAFRLFRMGENRRKPIFKALLCRKFKPEDEDFDFHGLGSMGHSRNAHTTEIWSPERLNEKQREQEKHQLDRAPHRCVLSLAQCRAPSPSLQSTTLSQESQMDVSITDSEYADKTTRNDEISGNQVKQGSISSQVSGSPQSLRSPSKREPFIASPRFTPPRSSQRQSNDPFSVRPTSPSSNRVGGITSTPLLGSRNRHDQDEDENIGSDSVLKDESTHQGNPKSIQPRILERWSYASELPESTENKNLLHRASSRKPSSIHMLRKTSVMSRVSDWSDAVTNEHQADSLERENSLGDDSIGRIRQALNAVQCELADAAKSGKKTTRSELTMKLLAVADSMESSKDRETLKSQLESMNLLPRSVVPNTEPKTLPSVLRKESTRIGAYQRRLAEREMRLQNHLASDSTSTGDQSSFTDWWNEDYSSSDERARRKDPVFFNDFGLSYIFGSWDSEEKRDESPKADTMKLSTTKTPKDGDEVETDVDSRTKANEEVRRLRALRLQNAGKNQVVDVDGMDEDSQASNDNDMIERIRTQSFKRLSEAPAHLPAKEIATVPSKNRTTVSFTVEPHKLVTVDSIDSDQFPLPLPYPYQSLESLQVEDEMKFDRLSPNRIAEERRGQSLLGQKLGPICEEVSFIETSSTSSNMDHVFTPRLKQPSDDLAPYSTQSKRGSPTGVIRQGNRLYT